MENTTAIEGRQPVLELLRSKQEINKILVAKGQTQGSIREILALAKQQRVVVQEVERNYLDRISETQSHQGVVAQIAGIKYQDLDEILKKPIDPNWPPLYLILDGLQDPHNLGSLLRSSEAARCSAVIIPKRRAVGVTATVVKVSTGAANLVPVCRVSNIVRTIEILKDNGVWVAGADMGGDLCYSYDLTGPIALVIGGEGQGLSRLVKENCDYLARLPMHGQINSLNAGVAGALLMFEVVRQRLQV